MLCLNQLTNASWVLSHDIFSKVVIVVVLINWLSKDQFITCTSKLIVLSTETELNQVQLLVVQTN